MKRVTSKLLVLPVGGDAGRAFRDVGIHVFGQFCVRDREARRENGQIPGEAGGNKSPAHSDSARDVLQKRRSQWSQNTQRICRQAREG